MYFGFNNTLVPSKRGMPASHEEPADAKRGFLDRSLQTLERQMQKACWNKKHCQKMLEFGPATDNARVPCEVVVYLGKTRQVTDKWREMTPRDVFQYNNPKSNPEESHSTQKQRETEEKLEAKKLLPRAGLLRIELQCQSCEESLETIRAADTIESLYQEIQRLVVHDKGQPLLYTETTKVDPSLPDDAKTVCELTLIKSVNEFVTKKVQDPGVLESIRLSLNNGKLKEILDEKSVKAKDTYNDEKKTYIRCSR